jgi:diguanylate cyclase (GGDEF)-like protein/PAS domain S-box-containing protein
MERIFIGMQKCLADDVCTFIHISQQFLKRIGYTREEIRERFCDRLLQLILPEDRERVRWELSEQLAQGDEFTLEYRVQAKDGEVVWLYDQGSRAVEDGVEYLYCETADATRYHRMDSRYRHILNSLPNPVVITNLDRQVQFLNKTAERLFGAPLEQCMGKSCAELGGCPMRFGAECCIDRFLRGVTSNMVDQDDGQSFRLNLTSLLDDEGRPVGYISVGMNVTELRRAERQLRISEERYRIAMQQTQNSIWEYDVAGKTFFRMNAGADAVTETLTNVPDSMIAAGQVHPDSMGQFLELFHSIRRGESRVRSTVRLDIHGNGAFRWYELACSVILDEQGRPARVIGISRDVTQERHLEQRFWKEKLYRDSLISDAMTAYEANLTRDALIRVDDVWFKGFLKKAPGSYNELINAVAEHAVNPKYRRTMRETLGREGLLHAFAQGRREVSCEYQRIDASGNEVWVNCTVCLIEPPEQKEIYAFIYIKNIDVQKRRELELKKKAEFDQLTGLYNRTTAIAKIDEALGGVHDGAVGAMFMLDIDHFKQINDTYGHLYGDAVLSELAQKLGGLFRRGDVIGRLGGDEFVVYLREIPSEELALQKAGAILKEMHIVFSSGGKQCVLSGSVGVAFAPRHGVRFDELYEKADLALYHAKNQGKNQYAVYHESLVKLNTEVPYPTEIEKRLSKRFAQNVSEYVFKILYHSGDLSGSITAVLELLCKHLGAVKGYVCEYNAAEQYGAVTFIWSAAHGDRWSDTNGRSISGELWRYFDEEGLYVIPKLSLNGEERAVLLCAFVVDGEFRGFLGMEMPQAMREFTLEERDVMRSASEIIGTFLIHQRTGQEKEKYTESLKTVLDNTASAVYVVSPANYQLVYLNSKTIRLFPKAEVGQSCYRLFRGFDAPCADCPMRGLGDEMQDQHVEEVHNEMVGSWVSAAAGWVKWTDGKRYCMITCTDVTRYKQGMQEES